MSFDHVSPPEMLLRQHLDIFSALQKRDGDAVERAMTQHLQEISESVRQIRQKTATGLAKSNSFTLIPFGMRVFPRLMAHACIKRCELDQKQKIFHSTGVFILRPLRGLRL